MNVGDSDTDLLLLTSTIVADHLRDTKFEADILQITEKFDQSTKLRFVGPDDAQFIRFGRWSDNAPELNIRAGQLKLPG